MAALGEDEQARAAGALGTAWPPPPTCSPVEAAPPRRLLLPVHLALPQLSKAFGLPKWAYWAFISGVLLVNALDLQRRHSFTGQVIVGLLVAFYSVPLFTLLLWGISALRLRLGHSWQPPRSFNGTAWKTMLQSLGGWMGLVPVLVFWAWGLLYLFRGPIRWASSAATSVWAVWFGLGCIAAVVNGVGQWLRERRAPAGKDDEHGIRESDRLSG